MFGAQEEGNGRGLGLLREVRHLPRELKTPHIGWSQVTAVIDSPFGTDGSDPITSTSSTATPPANAIPTPWSRPPTMA